MSFVDQLFENLTGRPELAAVVEIDGTERRRFDGNQLADLARRAQGFVRSKGIEPGDRVGLLAPNSARWVSADLGALAAGAVVVPLYARQDPRELVAMLQDAGARLLLCGDQELADGIRDAWPDACPIALFDEVFAAPAAAPDQRHPIAQDDLVTLIYTSGTSGRAKGVMLTRANVDFMLPKTIDRLREVVNRGNRIDKVFHFLPFCFAASRIMLWTQLTRPNPIMVSTDLSNLVEEMKTADPNYYLNVPAVLERVRNGVGEKVRERGGLAQALYDTGFEAYKKIAAGKAGFLDKAAYAVARSVVFEKIKHTIGPSLEFLISGSAPLSEDTQRWFEALGIPVYQAYGLTETTGIVTLDKRDRVAPGRVGFPIEGVEVKLGEGDEILVRGPNLSKGYFNMPEETARTIRDGWLHTGDVGEVVGGNYRIVGRLKNLVIPESGHNIAPEPLEQRFMEACPRAEQCMIVGHGRRGLGIIVTGAVDDDAVRAALDGINADVPHYRKIRVFHRSDEPFSIENGLLTANQKLRRAVIEDHFRAQIDRMYE